MARSGIISVGIVLLFMGILGWIIPITEDGQSVTDMNDLCNSILGQIGSAINKTAQENCILTKNISNLIYALIGIGALLTIIGSILKEKKSFLMFRCQYCGHYCEDERDEMNHRLKCDKKKSHDEQSNEK